MLCGMPSRSHADGEHDLIASERAAVTARFAAQVNECETRFVVAMCLEDAATESRRRLALLHRQQLTLDESRRRASAEARRKAIADRAEAQQIVASGAASEAPRVRLRRELAAPPRAALAASAPKLLGADTTGARDAVPNYPPYVDGSQTRFDARIREAQAHREAVAHRNAERVARGKAEAPLPVPPGASAAY